MKQFFSEFFEIPEDTLEDHGAFNISLLSDLPLFIDPFLLFTSKKPEYIKLHKQIIKYLVFLRDKAVEDELNNGLIDAWYKFPEVKQNWLGYSKTTNKGSGLGIKFANALTLNLQAFHKFGHKRISRNHFEKLCLFNSGVGKDNISDFTTNLIKDFLLHYTQDFARKHLDKKFRAIHRVKKVRFDYETTETWIPDSFELPTYDGEYIILTPVDMLTKDETWINRPDFIKNFRLVIDSVPDATLRAQFTNYFENKLVELAGEEKPTGKQQTEAVNDTILQFPELIEYYVKGKEDSGNEAESISSSKVFESKQLYIKHFKQLGWKLFETTAFYNTESVSFDDSLKRLNIIKDTVENNGGNEVFYFGGKPIEDEDNLSILFRLTWKAGLNKLESNSDSSEIITSWKESKNKLKIVLKLSTNSQIRKTFEKIKDVYDELLTAQEYILVLIHYSHAELNSIKTTLKQMSMSEHKNIVFINASKAEEIESEEDNTTKNLQSNTLEEGNVFEGYGLLIGVGADLADTVTDATALYDVLVNPKRAAYPPENVQLLTENRSKRQDILDGFDTLIKQSKETNIETAIVYYSGHGGKIGSEYYLAPFEFNRNLPKQTGISGKEFTDKIEAVKAKKLLVILDCCRAGGIPITKDTKAFFNSNPPKDFLDTLSKGAGKVIIASSQENEPSLAGSPYSAFTKCLLEALSGKGTRYSDGYAKIFDILSHLFKEVPAQTKDQQHPFLNNASNISEDFAVCYYAGGLKEIPGSPVSSEQVNEIKIPVTTGQTDRLKIKLEGLNSSWKKLQEKIDRFREELMIEASLPVKIQLEQKLLDSEAERSRLESQIEEIEHHLGK